MTKTYFVTQTSYGTVTVDVPTEATEEEIRKIVEKAVMNREADFYEYELQDYGEADGYNDEENYPYLSQTRDFAILKERYSESTLKEFETEIREYEEAELPKDYQADEVEATPIIAWYAGLLTTNDLFDIWEPDYPTQERRKIL